MNREVAWTLSISVALFVAFVLWLVTHSPPPAQVAVTPAVMTVTPTGVPSPSWEPTLAIAAVTASPRAAGTATATSLPAVILTDTPIVTTTAIPSETPMPTRPPATMVQKG